MHLSAEVFIRKAFLPRKPEASPQACNAPKPSVFPTQRSAPRAEGRWAQVSASLYWAISDAPAASPAPPRSRVLRCPPSRQRKANYITQQAWRRLLSFQVFARGRRGGRGLDVTLLHSLSLCQSRDIFFSFLYSLPPAPPQGATSLLLQSPELTT